MEVPSNNQDTITYNSVSGISNNKGDNMSEKEKIALLLDFLHDYVNGTYIGYEDDELERANSIIGAVKSNELLETHLVEVT